MGNVHHHTSTSTTAVHRTRRSQIPLSRENESTNSGNTDDEPFRVVDDHHALDGVDDAADHPFEDDFPNDNAFLDSGSEGEGEEDENDERDDADHSVYDSLHTKLVVQVHGSKVPLRERLHIFLQLHKAMW